MAEWLAQRAEQVERAIGLLGVASDLLQLALHTHPQDQVGAQLGSLHSFQAALQGECSLVAAVLMRQNSVRTCMIC